MHWGVDLRHLDSTLQPCELRLDEIGVELELLGALGRLLARVRRDLVGSAARILLRCYVRCDSVRLLPCYYLIQLLC